MESCLGKILDKCGMPTAVISLHYVTWAFCSRADQYIKAIVTQNDINTN